MAKAVNERLPLHRIDIILAQDEVAANMRFENPDLNRSSASEFAQSRFALKHMGEKTMIVRKSTGVAKTVPID